MSSSSIASPRSPDRYLSSDAYTLSSQPTSPYESSPHSSDGADNHQDPNNVDYMRAMPDYMRLRTSMASDSPRLLNLDSSQLPRLAVSDPFLAPAVEQDFLKRLDGRLYALQRDDFSLSGVGYKRPHLVVDTPTPDEEEDSRDVYEDELAEDDIEDHSTSTSSQDSSSASSREEDEMDTEESSLVSSCEPLRTAASDHLFCSHTTAATCYSCSQTLSGSDDEDEDLDEDEDEVEDESPAYPVAYIPSATAASPTPPRKRPRSSSPSSSCDQLTAKRPRHDRTRSVARGPSLSLLPASLRRAQSLRSDASVQNLQAISAVQHPFASFPDALPPSAFQLPVSNHSISTRTSTSHHSTSDSEGDHSFEEGAPTEPASPASSRARAVVPILAPPPWAEIPRAPLTTEDGAERRLRVLVTKERAERVREGWRDVGEGDDSESEDGEGGSAGVMEWGGASRKIWPALVEWMVEDLPRDARGHREYAPDLADQLTAPACAPETLFHAAHMLARYLAIRARDEDKNEDRISEGEQSDVVDGEEADVVDGAEAILWDAALACVALSVKFHRDPLRPLHIVPAATWTVFAPHHIDEEDLEGAHRDVFATLGYTLGTYTPQAFLDELWQALPNLRRLLEFRNGWKVAQRGTWRRLLCAVQAPSVLGYPLAHLAAAALALALVDALVYKYAERAARRAGCVCGARPQQRQQQVEEEMWARAQAAVNRSWVVEDVVEVLGIAWVAFWRCEEWLVEIEEADV